MKKKSKLTVSKPNPKIAGKSAATSKSDIKSDAKIGSKLEIALSGGAEDATSAHAVSGDKPEAKQRLLEAASKLFAEKGLEGTSVRDIAASAGLNLSLVSYYFGGKEGLYKELIRNFALTIRSKIGAIVVDAESEELSQENLEKVLTLIVAGISEIRSAHPEMSLVMHRERLAGLPHGREIHEDIFGPLGESLSQYMQRAQKKGLVRKELNPLLVFIFLQEALVGFHNMVACNLKIVQSCNYQTKNFKDFQTQLVQIFVKGIFT